jgi:arylsulfatase A-like enzyme
MVILIIINPAITLVGFLKNHTGHAEAASALGRIKHVLLISVDTLRPDFLSCYDPQAGNTPNIDQLAEDGILFRRAISSSPWTLPSMASIMTGLPNAVHTATKPFTPLPDTLETLAEIMRDNGYKTSAIGDNQFLKSMYNVSQGFREYNFFPKPENYVGYSLGARIVFTWLFPHALLDEATTADLTRLTLDWIESNSDHDFFIWLHYFDPHMPYTPPQPYLPSMKPLPSMGWSLGAEALDKIRSGNFVPDLAEREWVRMLYNGEIHYVDDNIGRIIGALKEYNLYDESLIILTSDHGEEFWEHGGFEHGHTLYDEVIHVPLILKLPASLPGTYQRQISTTVSTQCILPTILELCGIAYDDDGMREKSLVPLWDANAGKYQKSPVFSSSLIYYEDRESVIFDEKKYIRFLITDGEELYDLKRDPAEQKSLASSRFRETEKGKDLLDAHRKTAEEMKAALNIEETRKVELDEETLKRLRTLGYVK